MSGHRKNKALLSFTVCISLLCLLHISCAPNGEVDDPESNAIHPDQFALNVKEIYKNQGTDNTIRVEITPGSSGMMLREFFVTASLEDNKGIVHGNRGKKKSGKPVYDVILQDHRLESLFIQSPSSCLGKEDTHFAQGEKVSFRIKAIPDATIKRGDRYTLTVKVEREGSNPHTKTKSITMKAKQDGVDTKEQTEEVSTSDTSTQATSTALNAVPDNAKKTINHPIPNEDVLIPAEKTNKTYTSPPILISDTDLPATPNREVLHTSSAQITDPPDSTTAASSDNAGTSAQKPASHQFTVTPKEEKSGNSMKNFVLVTIKPSSNGMKLKEFAVTASLLDKKGTVMGSSGKNGNNFVYRKKLNNCNLEEIFLANKQSNCLGKNDACFAQGEEVTFRIEVIPCEKTTPGKQYTLTIKVERKGSHPHTETKSIPLTTPKKSPVKEKNRTSPRK
jgi:ribosomal protein S19